MDVLTPQQRSFNMSRIRSKNTKPERFIFEELDKRNILYEKHYAAYGKPDVAFPEYKIAVFIDGEFWHGKYFKDIKFRLTEFWIRKITNNQKRDRKNRKLLRQEGWQVIRLWDDDIKKNGKREIKKILRAIKKRTNKQPEVEV